MMLFYHRFCNTVNEHRKTKQNPTTREEILALAEQIKKLPKEKGWFIIPHEIVNFPKILKAWHSFFFLDELK